MNSSYSVGIGNARNNSIVLEGYAKNAIAIGKSAMADQSYSIALGSGVSAISMYDIQIGQVTSKGKVMIADIDIRELKKTINKLEQIVEKQEGLINAMWYAPGMPGAAEASDMWESDVKSDVVK